MLIIHFIITFTCRDLNITIQQFSLGQLNIYQFNFINITVQLKNFPNKNNDSKFNDSNISEENKRIKRNEVEKRIPNIIC